MVLSREASNRSTVEILDNLLKVTGGKEDSLKLWQILNEFLNRLFRPLSSLSSYDPEIIVVVNEYELVCSGTVRRVYFDERDIVRKQLFVKVML